MESINELFFIDPVTRDITRDKKDHHNSSQGTETLNGISVFFGKQRFTKTGARNLLASYIAEGDGFVQKAKISASFMLWDRQKNKLLLVRDHFATTPLFYLSSKKRIRVSSRINPILDSMSREREINKVALNNFLTYGYIPNPDTIFKSIRQVKPGHFLRIENGSSKEVRYWSFRYQEAVEGMTAKEYIQTFKELFNNSVKDCLEQNPNAGAFLSGGLDTGAVVSMMARMSNFPIKVFTAGFHEKQYNEIDDAKIISNALKLEHYTTIVKMTDNFPDLLYKLVKLHESPFSDTSAIPTYFAAKLAKEHVDTVLTGDFPDQLIGGSGHQADALRQEKDLSLGRTILQHETFRRLAEKCPYSAGTPTLINKIKRALYRGTFPIEEQRILLNMPVPPNLKACLYNKEMLSVNKANNPMQVARDLYGEVPEEDLLHKILYFDINSYAPDDLMVKVHRMCSAHELKTISPFHNLELVEFIAATPSRLKIKDFDRKYIMKEALRPILPKQTLKKKKQGFAMPMGLWLKNNMTEFVRDTLLSSKSLNRGYFNKKFLSRMVDDFLNDKTDYATGSESTIISLITLELWHNIYMDPQQN